MTGSKLTIKLTADQQKQIKDATGKGVTELNIDLGSSGSLSDQALGDVSGGISIMKVLDKTSPL